MSLQTPAPKKPFQEKLRSWLLGVLLLAGLIMVISHIGELENFAILVRRAEPVWLLLALLLQVGTYLSVAAVWYLALRAGGTPHSFLSLVPLGIAKLFSDQAMPSGGMSGTAFFIAALSRRGVPNHVCMATLLLSLVAYYGAYLLAALATLLLLYSHHEGPLELRLRCAVRTPVAQALDLATGARHPLVPAVDRPGWCDLRLTVAPHRGVYLLLSAGDPAR